VESQIADAQGISRTPVREAIHKLERERFIERRPTGDSACWASAGRISSRLRHPQRAGGYAARLAALNYGTDDLEPLQAKIDEFQRLLEKKQLKSLPEVNTQFHDLLYALSAVRVCRMIDGLRDHIFRFRQIILKDAQQSRTSNEDHRLMLEYIRRGMPRG